MLKVLIADDEIKVSQLVFLFFYWEELGMEVIGIVNDGVKAYEIIVEKQPDIVITDIRMPGMDGIELVEKTIRELEFGKKVFFVIISGYSQFEYAQQAVKLGVEDYLLKPIKKKELEAVKEARAQGDLSENFEYKAAKQDKNRNESRIRYLEKMLKNARIVSDDSRDDEVGINNTVEIYFEDDDETEVYRLVTSVRGNSLQGLISIESPLGKAIRGHKEGDRVKVKTSKENGYYVVIRKIDKTTDDSNDTLRKY